MFLHEPFPQKVQIKTKLTCLSHVIALIVRLMSEML